MPVWSVTFAVKPDSTPTGHAALVSVDANDAEVFEVLEGIGERSGVTVGVESGFTAKVTLHTGMIPWQDALRAVAEKAHGEVVTVKDGVYFVRPSSSPAR
jgi:hypothetical protein